MLLVMSEDTVQLVSGSFGSGSLHTLSLNMPNFRNLLLRRHLKMISKGGKGFSALVTLSTSSSKMEKYYINKE